MKSTHHNQSKPIKALEKYRPKIIPKEIRQILIKPTSQNLKVQFLNIFIFVDKVTNPERECLEYSLLSRVDYYSGGRRDSYPCWVGLRKVRRDYGRRSWQ